METQKSLDGEVSKLPMGYREEVIQWEFMPRKQLFLCPYCQYSSRSNKKGSAFIKPFPDHNAWFHCFFCHKQFIIFDKWFGKTKGEKW